MPAPEADAPTWITPRLFRLTVLFRPGPPLSVSRPGVPVSTSFPGPPISVFGPDPPRRRSLPRATVKHGGQGDARIHHNSVVAGAGR